MINSDVVAPHPCSLFVVIWGEHMESTGEIPVDVLVRRQKWQLIDHTLRKGDSYSPNYHAQIALDRLN